MNKLLSRTRLRVFISGCFAVIAISVFLFTGIALHVGSGEIVPIWMKVSVDLILLSALIKLLHYFLIKPLYLVRNLEQFCSTLENRGEFFNQLSAAEEVIRKPERWRGSKVDEQLTDRLLLNALSETEKIDLHRLYPSKVGLKVLWLSLVGLILAAFLFATIPSTLVTGFFRLSNPTHNEKLPTYASLFLAQEEIVVSLGEPVDLIVIDASNSDSEVVCNYRVAGGSWMTGSAVIDSSSCTDLLAHKVYRLDELYEPVEYYFHRAGENSKTGYVKIKYPPLINRLSAVIKPPSYTGLPEQVVDRLPAFVSIPELSHLELSAEVSEVLQSANAQCSDKIRRELAVQGSQISANWIIENSFTFDISLTDKTGAVGVEVAKHQVVLLPDMPPSVNLQSDPDNGIMPVDEMVTLFVNSMDDYGIKSVVLEYSTDGVNWPELQTVAAEEAVIDMAFAQLTPGESVKIRVKVTDNKPVKPGVAYSNEIEFRLPTAAELLTMDDESFGESEQQLDELQKQSQKTAEELEKLRRELMKDPETDWMKRQDIEETLHRQEMMQQEMSEIAEELQQQMDDLVGREMASEELLEKMEQVGQLMQQVQSEELKKMQEQLSEAMNELTDEQIKDAVEEASENQKKLLEKLDRTISLLEQMQREQEMEGMVSMLEQMIRAQEELSQTNDSEKQAELAQQMQDLAQKMQEALDKLKEMDQSKKSPSDLAMEEALEEAMKQLQEGDLEEAMKEASKKMEGEQSGSPSDSAQQQSRRELAALYHIMLQGQQGMQMSMDQFIKVSMRKIAFDLILISNRQEEILKVVPDDPRDLELTEVTRSQQRLLDAVVKMRERLGELMGRSSSMSGKLLDSLDYLSDEMAGVVNRLTSGYKPGIKKLAVSSLEKCNRLIIDLLTGAEMSGGGGGGSFSMPSMGEQLQQMAKEQAGLNGLSQQMQQQGLSQETRAGMQRLQGQQGGLAGKMQELAQEKITADDDKRLLGDLEDLAKEMQKIADEIASGNLNEDVLRRQERILSRMLDAKHSVHKRDYSRKRESKTADSRFTDNNGEESQSQKDIDLIERRYSPPVDGVPLEYRELVREYFKSLQLLEEGTQ